MTSIKTEVQDGLCLVHLNDGKANAINKAFLDGLSEAMDRAEADQQSMVLIGRPGFFSGGLDLKTLPSLPPDELLAVLKQFGEVMMRLFVFPQPVVAACTGHAIAGGSVTLLACDERVATEGKFKLGLNETAIGLSLPLFVVEFARCQIGPQHLQAVITNGELFTPEQARDIGLVQLVLPPDDVIPAAIKRAKELSVLPGQAYADNKKAIRGPFDQLGRNAYEEELVRFQGFFDSKS